MEFVLPTHGPFALAELATLGFGHNTTERFDGVMRMAFCLDGTFGHVGLEVRQDGAKLHCVAQGGRTADQAAVSAQVARVLSIDHDGEGFAEVGRKDPVIGKLQAAAPGLRPPQFYSPYEAAVWSIISARRARVQAAQVRDRLAREHGTVFQLAGQAAAAVPGPDVLLGIDGIPGLPADRMPRLHAVARAALDGRLDVGRLTAMDPEAAMAELQDLPGIGPFYSSLVLIRSCGLADVLPTTEAKLLTLIPRLYDVAAPVSDEAFAALAESWRPFRTWAAVLIRAAGPRILAAE